MKKNLLGILVIFISLSFSFPQPPMEDPVEIEWLTIEEAVERSKKEPRKIFVDVYTDWCGWCKKMDANTFNNPVIAKYISENYYAVKFNAEQKEDVEFKGQVFKYVASGRRGYHELAVALLNQKLSYPTVVFIQEELEWVYPIPGYQKPENLHPILKYMAEGTSKEVTWEQFSKTYQSPF
ncbi:thioredoxin family protein [Flexithrix dorotheae]|uniref:thioredoxin family protein n=1 Tax=Flexithrix dorotheae TaxID=70993 RepID=UPI000364187F|nr:DUF255 domain-containing protein [Flexithrix dorotheae]